MIARSKNCHACGALPHAALLVRCCSVWVLCIILFLWLPPNMAGAGWDIEGELTYSIRMQPERPMVQKRFQFRVQSDGCRSLIRTARSESGDFIESLIGDGTIRTLYHHNRTNLQSSGRLIRTAEVASREVPRDDSSNIGYLWLAYGSACYLDKRTANRLKPLWIQDDPALDSEEYTVEAEWIRHPSERLPRHVIYFNDGMMRTRRSGGSVVKPWPAPFDQGFKHAIYEARQGTNLAGVFIPTHFVFTRYGVESNGKGGFELAVITQSEGTVKSIREATSVELSPPGFDGVVGVSDYRFVRSNAATPTIRYDLTNGAWPDDERSRQIFERHARIQDRLAKSKQPHEAKTGRRALVLVALATTSIGTLVLLSWVTLRRR